MEEEVKQQAAVLIRMALAEDLGEHGDITSAAISEVCAACKGILLAKAEGTLAGIEIVRMVFDAVDPALESHPLAADGQHVHKGQILMQVWGEPDRLLMAERTALNFIGRLSGIATLTQRFVDAVAGTRARILDTRKTTPGWRLLEKYAVRCGGGLNHRMGLYDLFLIKDNHIVAAGGITPAVERCRKYARKQGLTAGIEVEVRSLAEVEEALNLGVDRIMLDNMPLTLMHQAVERCAGRIPLEASGNVNLTTVAAIAQTGVDYISSGSLTHSAPVLDISLDLESR
ncbi:MAG TPA: carboxylating nicotinate-nucleotide diphosphorylase [bacterium]|nr:carboxylating nicotinate-nucleotide diphosphorylase [bacterium]HQI48820.1 carboxylating nicotinate-nucleotide diphosphorylase [bacterium]HQJ65569.1 carboxylating nicotinate-nucleotide diphosphorylase [bacterium]